MWEPGCRFCSEREERVQSVDDLKCLDWLHGVDWSHIRERPAASPVTVTSIDDTSNFDDFPEVALEIGERRQVGLLVVTFVLQRPRPVRAASLTRTGSSSTTPSRGLRDWPNLRLHMKCSRTPEVTGDWWQYSDLDCSKVMWLVIHCSQYSNLWYL